MFPLSVAKSNCLLNSLASFQVLSIVKWFIYNDKNWGMYLRVEWKQWWVWHLLYPVISCPAKLKFVAVLLGVWEMRLSLGHFGMNHFFLSSSFTAVSYLWLTNGEFVLKEGPLRSEFVILFFSVVGILTAKQPSRIPKSMRQYTVSKSSKLMMLLFHL